MQTAQMPLDISDGVDDDDMSINLVPVSVDTEDAMGIDSFDRYGFSGGQQYTDPEKEFRLPMEVLRARELKWMTMCRNWEVWVTKRRQKLRERCRKGIPDSVRSEAWQRLCASRTTLVEKIRVRVTDPKEKPRSFNLFSSQNKLNTARSLPTVVTNSPSFRLKRHQADVRDSRAATPASPGLGPFRRGVTQEGSLRGSRKFSGLPNFGSLFRLNQRNQENDVASRKADNKSRASVTITTSYPLQANVSTTCNSNANSQQRAYDAVLPSPGFLGLPGDSVGTCYSQEESMDTNSLAASSSRFYSADGVSDTGSIQSLSFTGAGEQLLPQDGDMDTSVDGAAMTMLNGLPPIVPTSASLDRRKRLRGQRERFLTPLNPNGGADSPSLSIVSSSTSQASSFSPLTSLLSRSPADEETEVARDSTLVPPNADIQEDPYSLYDEYLRMSGDPNTCDQIEKDIHRQFPFHELFCQKKTHGRESLYQLRAP